MSRKQWYVLPSDRDMAEDITEQYDIEPFLAHLLVSRGIIDDVELEDFCFNNAELLDPYDLIDMDKAVYNKFYSLLICSRKYFPYFSAFF